MPLEVPPAGTGSLTPDLDPQPPQVIASASVFASASFQAAAVLILPDSVDYTVEILRVLMSSPNPKATSNTLRSSITFPDGSNEIVANLSTPQPGTNGGTPTELAFVQPLQLWPGWQFDLHANAPSQSFVSGINMVIWWQLRRLPYLVSQGFPHSTKLPWTVSIIQS